MCPTNLRNCYAPVNVVKALNWYIFRQKSGRLSSTGSEILNFGSHCWANFQPILDCFIPKFKLDYENLENIKTDCLNTVVFSLHQIKRLKSFLGHPVYYCMCIVSWSASRQACVDETSCYRGTPSLGELR